MAQAVYKSKVKTMIGNRNKANADAKHYEDELEEINRKAEALEDESTELSGYLQGTLLKIDEASNQSKSCIPGHADPDGHCLVHAISRCLTGIGF